MQVLGPFIACLFLPGLATTPLTAPSSLPTHLSVDVTGARQRTTAIASPVFGTTHSSLDYLSLAAEWEAPSHPASLLGPAIKQEQPPVALCGLGGFATAQATNPFVFVMQVLGPFIACLFLPGLATTPLTAPSSLPTHLSVDVTGARQRTTAIASPVFGTTHSSLDYLSLAAEWEAPSHPASLLGPAIKQEQPPVALCGLGGFATAQATNPFVFVMQVGERFSLFAKKSNNYFLVQLPSPQCLNAVLADCFHLVLSLLLLLSGDIETNPGPDNAAILAELKKISTGQSKLISEVQDLKSQLLATDRNVSDLGKRMAELESHYESLVTLKTDTEVLRADTTKATRLISKLEARFDDAENRTRRNNLVFYGLPETTPESYAQSEQLIIKHCREHLDIHIDTKEIERAHRLGRHSNDKPRPIITKFTFFKTKETVLSSARKLKGTNYSIGEDFSRAVRIARSQLVAFARKQSAPFNLRYKTLHIGPKRYVFDSVSETVREML
ncbi:uncharacterized protein LOC142582112 [Dermacentor variabilis]|uniref:uncharacterized protein LOC142582112 n=1 Tax=Dermacentor variabilis TaxID=34621 RepID=UPI003F5C66A7